MLIVDLSKVTSGSIIVPTKNYMYLYSHLYIYLILVSVSQIIFQIGACKLRQLIASIEFPSSELNILKWLPQKSLQTNISSFKIHPFGMWQTDSDLLCSLLSRQIYISNCTYIPKHQTHTHVEPCRSGFKVNKWRRLMTFT